MDSRAPRISAEPLRTTTITLTKGRVGLEFSRWLRAFLTSVSVFTSGSVDRMVSCRTDYSATPAASSEGWDLSLTRLGGAAVLALTPTRTLRRRATTATSQQAARRKW